MDQAINRLQSDAKEARDAQIRSIKQRLADLQGRWPKHSVPPAMLQELEELEDQLAELEAD